MKLVQFYLPEKGERVGVVDREGKIIDVTSDEAPSVLELIQLSYEFRISLGVVIADIQDRLAAATPSILPGEPTEPEIYYDDLDVPPDKSVPHLLIPITPPEVWGCGVTYKRSADMRDEDSVQDIYSRVYFSERPEIFFKATASRCVGPNDYICIRRDSKLTATEPELAYVLGADGEIVGYTLCNDVSAWDIERDNPLYLTQSKIFYGCCAIGPTLATTSEITDPYDLDMQCRIVRDEEVIYEDEVNTSQLNRKFEELTEYLCRDNPIPIGTVVSTGTGIIVPNDMPLVPGDIVEISIEEIGTLSNTVKQLG
jgi:2-dehydro-3-deoxy-D-arabinonate dehydratase